MAAAPQAHQPYAQYNGTADSHSSMLRVLGDHLHALGVLLTRYASTQDYESACNLQRDIRTMATARDSPLGEGYMVPGAKVDRHKWKPLAIDIGVWELPINGVRNSPQQSESLRATPVGKGFARLSGPDNGSPYQPVKLGFPRTADHDDGHAPLTLGRDSRVPRSNGSVASSGVWDVCEESGKSSLKNKTSTAFVDFKNTESVEEIPERRSGVSKVSVHRGSHRNNNATTLARKSAAAPAGGPRCTIAHPLHPLADELKKRNEAMKKSKTADYEDDDEKGTCFWIFTSKTGDVLVATMIILNAFILGLQADIPWEKWDLLEIVFTIFFTGEMCIKMAVKGCRTYWRGKDWYWNWFDAFIVFFAITDLAYSQIVVRILTGSGKEFDLDGLIIIKMVRLCRLARLARLLRFKMFDELKMMIQGVVDGLRVLIWAIVLLFFFIYFLAMVMQKAVQDVKDPRLADPFNHVPWAMFTIFRCFTDGCSAHDGTPLQAHLYERWGAKFMLPYMLIFLFVTIGLFNLIMAIFVDNVMENTKQRRRDERAQGARAQEKELRRLLSKLFTEFTTNRPKNKAPAAELNRTTTFNEMTTSVGKKLGNALGLKLKANQEQEEQEDVAVIDRDAFQELFANSKMQELIESLEINTCDHAGLFDILDADMSGELELDEVVVGLMNLRGPAEKTDMVGTLLCCRVIQQILRGFQEDVDHAHDQIYEKVMELETRMELMQE